MATDQIKDKRVPWSELEKYLETHQKTIATLLDLQNSNVMKIPQIETILPESFI